MAGCDDLNGDGYDDIAFATADYDASAMLVLPGRVEIHFGGPDMASSAPLVLHGELQPQSDANPNGDDGFGYSVSAAGDVNGDGYPDLIVGSRTLQPSDNMVGGKVRIYYGGPQMDSTPDVVLELAKTTDVGPEADVFGASVAGVGDVNGDGFADVAVGAPVFDVNFGGTAISRVYVYFGGTVPHASPDLELRGGRDSEELGTLVVPAGDVNHDGYADIAVLAPGIPPALGWNPNLFGKVYVFSGGPNAGQSTITSLSAGNDLFGGLAVLDIDGDGEAEMLVGQGNYYSADVATGWVSIYRKSDGYAVPARKLVDGVSWDPTISP
jgi:hypothetical protein